MVELGCGCCGSELSQFLIGIHLKSGSKYLGNVVDGCGRQWYLADILLLWCGKAERCWETDWVLDWFGCWLWEGGLEISDGISLKNDFKGVGILWMGMEGSGI
jgi:hypothetical protein